jgi:hypothetical protein
MTQLLSLYPVAQRAAGDFRFHHISIVADSAIKLER